jgi:hypothetical protein
MGKFKDRTKDSNVNFQGLVMTIFQYRGARDISVQFEDGTVIEKTAYKEFESGSIKNPNHPTVWGVGYIGQGKYTARIDTKMSKPYRTWCGMLQRCYSEKDRQRNPTYKDIAVCEEWHNFQNFAAWFDNNYVEGFYLDKDIICPDCKIYSPETCIFVPNEINVLFSANNISKKGLPIGVSHKDNKYQTSVSMFNKQVYLGFFDTVEEAFEVFKSSKEKHMKELAKIWKDKIDPRVYDALMNYEVKITD